MDIIDGSGLWSVTNNPIAPPPTPPVGVVGHGAGRGRFTQTMEDRRYYEALKYWLAQGRREPMSEAERQLLERARRMAQEEEELITLL